MAPIVACNEFLEVYIAIFLIVWWGKVAAPEKSPDLGNSSPVPRAFMYEETQTGVRTAEPDGNDETKAGWLRSGLREWSDTRLLLLNKSHVLTFAANIKLATQQAYCR